MQACVDKVKSIINDRSLLLVDKLTKISEVLSEHLNARIYFCGIRGKRWSFVAGSGDVLSGSHRFRLSETWGLISDRELKQDQFIRLIISMIREVLTD